MKCMAEKQGLYPLTFMFRILVGYFIAYFSFIPWIHKHNRVRERDPDGLQPEARLYWLLFGELTALTLLYLQQLVLFLIVVVAPLLSIGLFGFAWTSLGPPHVHWIAPMIFSSLIAIANVSNGIMNVEAQTSDLS